MSIYDFVSSVIGHLEFVDSEKYLFITSCAVLILMVLTINKLLLSIFGGK